VAAKAPSHLAGGGWWWGDIQELSEQRQFYISYFQGSAELPQVPLLRILSISAYYNVNKVYRNHGKNLKMCIFKHIGKSV